MSHLSFKFDTKNCCFTSDFFQIIKMSSKAKRPPGKLDEGMKAANLLTDAEIDALLVELSSEEIEALLEDVTGPDDSNLPPSARCTYRCDKAPTGPLDRRGLMKFIKEQAKNTKDAVDYVPHVPGEKKGKVWVDPNQSIKQVVEEDIDFGDLGDEIEMALDDASTQDMIDLAGIMGLHNMVTQEQFHHAHGARTSHLETQLDTEVGWDGITKATPLKYYPPEPPNLTDPVEVLESLQNGDEELTDVNLNNVEVSEKQMLDIIDALRGNETLTKLSVANTNLTDWAAANLCHSLECNNAIESLNIESNNVTPQTLAKLFASLNVQESVTELKAMNQAAQILGNKVEMSIAQAVEKNKTILKVGLQFEYKDCQNRVALACQKNMDRVRLKRIADALAERLAFDPCAGLRSVMPSDWVKAKAMEEAQVEKEAEGEAGDEDEYEYYTDDEEEEVDMGPPTIGRPHVPYPIDNDEE